MKSPLLWDNEIMTADYLTRQPVNELLAFMSFSSFLTETMNALAFWHAAILCLEVGYGDIQAAFFVKKSGILVSATPDTKSLR